MSQCDSAKPNLATGIIMIPLNQTQLQGSMWFLWIKLSYRGQCDSSESNSATGVNVIPLNQTQLQGSMWFLWIKLNYRGQCDSSESNSTTGVNVIPLNQTQLQGSMWFLWIKLSYRGHCEHWLSLLTEDMRVKKDSSIHRQYCALWSRNTQEGRVAVTCEPNCPLNSWVLMVRLIFYSKVAQLPKHPCVDLHWPSHSGSGKEWCASGASANTFNVNAKSSIPSASVDKADSNASDFML